MTKPYHFLPYSSFLAKIFKPVIEGRGEGRVELCRPVTNSRFRISKTDFQPFEKVSLSNEKIWKSSKQPKQVCVQALVAKV